MTPQEIYDYAESHDLMEDLWIASYFNPFGFDHGLVDGELVQKEDGIYAQFQTKLVQKKFGWVAFMDEIDECIHTSLSEEEYAKIQENNYTVLKVLVWVGDEVIGIHMVVADCGESKEEIYPELGKAVLLGFLEATDIDTVEKLEQVIQESKELIPDEIREEIEFLETDGLEDAEE